HLDHHLVASQNTDAVLAHLASGMGDDDVVIGDQFHAEGRIGQQLLDDALELQQFFLGQWVLLKPFASRGDRGESPETQAFPTVFLRYPPLQGLESAVSGAASAGHALPGRPEAAARGSPPPPWDPWS